MKILRKLEVKQFILWTIFVLGIVYVDTFNSSFIAVKFNDNEYG